VTEQRELTLVALCSTVFDESPPPTSYQAGYFDFELDLGGRP